MRDDEITSKVDDLMKKGRKLTRLSVEVTYQTFIGDYGATDMNVRALHVVIKCNGKVHVWNRSPISMSIEVFEKMISAYIKSEMEERLKKVAGEILAEAKFGVLLNGIDLNMAEFPEATALESERIEGALARGREVFVKLIADEMTNDQDALAEAERLLAKYESAHQVWKDIGQRRKRDAGQPIENQVRAIRAIHESVPAELIEEFLIDGRRTPSDMAYVHLARISKQTPDALEKAVKRARRKKRDILEKAAMSPKAGRKK